MIRAKRQSIKMRRILVFTGLLIAGALGGSAIEVFAAVGSFAFTGSLNTARYDHTATLLPSGEVLVTGGLGVNGIYAPLASAELYNPTKGKWTVTGSMSEGRFGFTATLLVNGEVLVAGGSGYNASCFASAELYNPSTGQWTPTGSMTQPRCYHGATLLPTGEVLVVGGVDSLFNSPDTLATAELYNPATGTWQTTGSLNTSRASEGAVLLENGHVLVAGGYNTSNGTSSFLASAELYDPSKGSWRLTASMRLGLDPAPLVTLPNSSVLVGNEPQFYSPATATWVNTGALPTVAGPPSQESLLNTGNVLASGTRCIYSGCGHKATTACYLYNSSTNLWSVAGSMNQPRLGHSSTLLSGGAVLVAGGYSGNLGDPTVLSTAELYTP